MTGLFFLEGDLSSAHPAQLSALLSRAGSSDAFVEAVRPLREAVRDRGDAALRELTKRFDGADVGPLEVPRSERRAALLGAPEALRRALAAAAANVRAFHSAQVREEPEIEILPGAVAGRRALPVARAGAYVPGGRASYPSTVLMCAVPARVAGVPEVVVCTPPGPDGRVPEATLAACEVAGVDRVFRVGGAQAVFAMAYGTESVPRCAKVVGPGNAYVAAAKALVCGDVSTDAPAGPSEVLVLADATARADLVARDLLAQAEHDPRAACVLVTTSRGLAEAVAAEVARLLPGIPRGSVVAEALRARGALLIVSSREEALAFADSYAPEHLHLQTDDPARDLRAVSNYGSAFLGAWATVALGDYNAGPNHVLPTGGLAASRAGLSVDDFLRRPTHTRVDPRGLRALATAAIDLARFEGLPNHAEAIEARLRALDRDPDGSDLPY